MQNITQFLTTSESDIEYIRNG